REVDVRVFEARRGDLGAVARLAVSEVRSAGDGEGRPGEVGGVERRRAAAVHVDALEEVVRMAEQTLWRRTGRGLPRRAREPAGVGRSKIDRIGAGGVGTGRRVAGRAGHVLPVRAVLMAGGALQDNRASGPGEDEGFPERMRIGAGDREPLAVIERARVAGRVTVQASLAVGRHRRSREVPVAVVDAPHGDRAERGMDLIHVLTEATGWRMAGGAGLLREIRGGDDPAARSLDAGDR